MTTACLFSVDTFVKDKASGQELGRAIARGRLTSMFRGDETSLMKEAAASVARFVNEAHTPTPSKMQQLKSTMGGGGKSWRSDSILVEGEMHRGAQIRPRVPGVRYS